MFLAVRQRRRVRDAQQEARAESGRFAATASDLVRNVRAVQAFGRSARAGGTFRTRNAAPGRPSAKRSKAANFTGS